VTTRPPPLNDPAVNSADEALEEALDDLDDAAASGDQTAIANAQAQARTARNELGRQLKAAGATGADYDRAKAEEAAAHTQQQIEPEPEPEPEPQKTEKGVHPAWYVGIFGAALLAGYAGYKAGGG